MYLQSIKSVKHNAANSVKSILRKSRHVGFDVLIVHSSMRFWILKMFKFHDSCLATVYSPVVVAVVVDRPMAVKHQPILTGLQGLGPYKQKIIL